MKTKKSVLLAVILFALTPFITFGQSQTAMNLDAAKQYKKADKELNAVYQKILKEYAAQPLFIKKFKAAQRLWVQLRNAELEAKFPEPADYGSVEPMCKAIYLASLTKERTSFLRVWLNGIEEGEACSGSVKVK
jgi:uncharacterized protein YecT (DUF1311 family)